MICAVVYSKEERDIMSSGVTKPFIKALMNKIKNGKERVIVNIAGVLVDILVEIDPTLYGTPVVYERRINVMYVQVLHAINELLQISLLCYKKYRKWLEGVDFKFNT